MKKKIRGLAAAAACAGMLASCGGAGGSSSATSGETTINYWLWDDTQAPLYQTCADDFMAANPNIKIEITQTAWGQYWQNLSTQIAAGSAPDVFVNHASYSQQFIDNGQVLDITDKVAEAGINEGDFADGTVAMTQFEGKQYGVPKDWDVVGLLYNVKVAEEAGFTAEEMNNLTWNPTDGGTFGEFIKATTIDSSGRNGLDPNFDKNNVVRYGYYPEWADGAIGQNGWGNFAHSNGFTYSDDQGVPTTFNYAKPEMVQVATWLQSLIKDGYAPPFDAQSTLGTDAVMNNEDAASTVAGSWTVGTYLDGDIEFAYAPVPVGPAGRTAAMNSLQDSIWAGSEHPDEAFKWVAYMGSDACQDKVGEAGLVFPARNSGTEKAMQAREAKGYTYDEVAFVGPVTAGETFTIPRFKNGTEVGATIQDAMMAIAQGAEPQSTLEAANTKAEEIVK